MKWYEWTFLISLPISGVSFLVAMWYIVHTIGKIQKRVDAIWNKLQK